MTSRLLYPAGLALGMSVRHMHYSDVAEGWGAMLSECTTVNRPPQASRLPPKIAILEQLIYYPQLWIYIRPTEGI